MTYEEERQSGLEIPYEFGCSGNVGVEFIEAIHVDPESGALAMATVVDGPTIVSNSRKVLHYVPVAPGVFGEAVHEEYFCAGFRVGLEALPIQFCTVGGGDGAFAVIHECSPRRSSRTLATASCQAT